MIVRDTNIQCALRSRQRGFLLNPFRFGSAPTPGETDPYWSNVVALLHFDGTPGSTTIVDETGRSWTNIAIPNVQLSNAYPKFGPTSGLWASGGGALESNNADGTWDFGTSPATMEAWIYVPTFQPNGGLFCRRIGAIYCPFEFRVNPSGNIEALIANATNDGWAAITTFSGVSVSAATQTHVAIVATGSEWQVYVNGVKSSTTIPYTTVAPSTQSMFIGRGGDGGYSGYIDEVRITKGVARYSANFTPPTSAFPNTGP